MKHWEHVDTLKLLDAEVAPGPGWRETRARHCQNGGDICLAGNHDGCCCPADSCDIDDGVRKMPLVNGSST